MYANKYETVEEMEQGYVELQKKFTKSQQGTKERISELCEKVRLLKSELDSLKKQENVVTKQDILKVRNDLDKLLS